MAEVLDSYLLIYLLPQSDFFIPCAIFKDLFLAGSTSEANTNTLNRNLLPLIQMSSLFFMAEKPIIKPAEVILQSSSPQHNSLSGSEREWDIFNMLLVIEFVPLIVVSGDLILLTSPELCLNLWKNKCDC